MAAVIDLHTGQHLPDALELPQRPRRPELRVLPGGAAGGSAPRRVAVPSHRVFVLRRIAVAVVAAVVVLVLAQALGALAGAVAGAVDPVPADSGRVHVVAAGETAWDIAGSLAP
jgi:hypothetical protein